MTDSNQKRPMLLTIRGITFLLLVILPALFEGCSGKKTVYSQGYEPKITIIGTNTGSVRKFEKFEAVLSLEDVYFDNPYDPADVDVYAVFTSPSGSEIKINGFYDDYRGTDKWKVRFSPGEAGEYKYRLFVKDGTAEGKSEDSSFTSVDSENHGWIRPSEKNPHYFAFADGKSYYPVGAYSPWGNSEKVFRTYAANNANFFAIWDISYGGFVNDAGIIENELGRYNQQKLGLIDSMLAIFEKDNIKMMFAIWPHDLFSKTVWAAQWSQNPYSKITDVENVYSDSLAWEYQKMKYRYMIARFAHSQSWGIWELINEMNGTDGWEKGHHREAYEWVAKCMKYFEENDPYHHPVTASFSGGYEEYRPQLYELINVPNLHLYPAQGWALKYPGDTLRSDMYNFAFASRRFWDNFEKPAIFGEAGADLTYYKPESKEYHVSYHNQIWASLVNGLAGTPVWWDFTLLNDQDWQQLKNLSAFVSDIDFANLPWKPAEATSDDADIFVMDAGDRAFGWARSLKDKNIQGTDLTIMKPEKGNFAVTWFDPWKGTVVTTENIRQSEGKLVLTVPGLPDGHPDIAFKISML